MRYKISEFSRLCQVSAKTLRYYDDVGLLKPKHIDPMTAYRYYEIDQLPRLNRILALKDLGFHLEQIAKILEEGLSPEQMRGMLRLKRAEAQQEMEDALTRLNRIEARLHQIEQEGSLPAFEMVIKPVESYPVASLRATLSTPADQGSLWADLNRFLAVRGIKPCGPDITVYHDPEYKDSDWDIEVCRPVAVAFEETAQIRFQTLPGVARMASTIHQGALEDIPLAYRALLDWISRNGYRICGPGRDIGWQMLSSVKSGPITAVIEAQFPVESIS